MADLATRLTTAQVEALRRRHPLNPDQSWVAQSVHDVGWVETNRLYLEAERGRGHAEMRDLLAELGLERARRLEEAVDLLEAAVAVFVTGDPATSRLVRVSPTVARIEITECPGYRLMEEQRWLGVTACSSWYRRRGWLNALGVEATDSVLAERKWGDPACVAEISVQRLARTAA